MCRCDRVPDSVLLHDRVVGARIALRVVHAVGKRRGERTDLSLDVRVAKRRDTLSTRVRDVRVPVNGKKAGCVSNGYRIDAGSGSICTAAPVSDRPRKGFASCGPTTERLLIRTASVV